MIINIFSLPLSLSFCVQIRYRERHTERVAQCEVEWQTRREEVSKRAQAKRVHHAERAAARKETQERKDFERKQLHRSKQAKERYFLSFLNKKYIVKPVLAQEYLL